MAQWSSIWSIPEMKVWQKRGRIVAASFTPPAAPKKRTGGKYPHLQPFFRYAIEDRKAA